MACTRDSLNPNPTSAEGRAPMPANTGKTPRTATVLRLRQCGNSSDLQQYRCPSVSAPGEPELTGVICTRAAQWTERRRNGQTVPRTAVPTVNATHPSTTPVNVAETARAATGTCAADPWTALFQSKPPMDAHVNAMSGGTTRQMRARRPATRLGRHCFRTSMLREAVSDSYVVWG
ncbi:hypothetical protein C8Q80DRAFT_1119550 [Daedaleopsis nitida]|nr:hypothetical protein C8Q80DRAFT_1119550 [Daedaleopsis nitida]